MDITTQSVLALVVALGLFYSLAYMAKKKVNFGIRTIAALIMGLALGLLFQGHVDIVRAVGQIYTRLISAIVVPLVFFSIISSITSLENLTKLRSIGLKTIFWLTVNVFIAGILGILISHLFNIGQGYTIITPADFVPREVPTFLETLVNMFPSNLASHYVNNQIVPIIIFALFISVAYLKTVSKLPEVNVFKTAVDAINKVIFGVIRYIIRLTPYAVLSLIAYAASRHSSNLDIWTFVVPVLVGYLACAIQTFLVHGSLIAVFTRLNPFTFFKKIFPAQMVAFSTQSSIGTIPVTVRQLSKSLGVNEEIASFVASLGANMGMPGCAGIWPAMLAVFSINALGLDYSFVQYAILILVIMMVSIGTVGVPGTATITATAVLATVGLPLEVIVMLAPISSLVDMARTATNVHGAATAAVIVAHREKQLDVSVYNTSVEKAL